MRACCSVYFSYFIRLARIMVKWFLSALLVISITAGIAVYYLKPTSYKISSISPKAPTPLSKTIPHPPSVVSSILVPIDIPYSELSAALEETVPLHLSGQEHNTLKRYLKDSQVNWAMQRTPFNVTRDNDKLSVSVDTHGQTRLKGKLLFAPVSAEMTFKANIHATLQPEITETWEIHPQLHAQLDIHEASIPLAGIDVSVKSLLQKAAQRSIDKSFKKASEKLRQHKRLKNSLEKQWTKLHKLKKVSEAPNTWFKIQPQQIDITRIEMHEHAMRLHVGILAETSLHLSNEAPEQIITPLPLKSSIDAMEGLNIELFMGLEWASISQQLAKVLKQKLAESPLGEWTLHRAILEPWGDRVLLTLDIEASHQWGQSASGLLHLTALPDIDAEQQVLRLRDIEFSTETQHSLLAGAVWILEGQLLSEIEKRSEVSLTLLYQRATQEANKHLSSALNHKASQSIALTGQIGQVYLKNIHITEQQLHVLVSAKGHIHGEVQTLKLK